MSDVLKLHPFDESGARPLGFVEPLQRLHAGLLVSTHHVRALGSEFGGILVGLADLLHVGLILLGGVALVLRR
jgi:hypothetical protein